MIKDTKKKQKETKEEKPMKVKVVTYTPVGWECPVCKIIHSPYVQYCPNHNN